MLEFSFRIESWFHICLNSAPSNIQCLDERPLGDLWLGFDIDDTEKQVENLLKYSSQVVGLLTTVCLR